MRSLCCVILTSLSICSCFAASAPPTETPRLQFVQEYERELSKMEEIYTSCRNDVRPTEDESKSSEFSAMIHCGTAVQLERRLEIRRLNQMHLGGKFKTLIPSLTAFYQNEIELYQRLTSISTAMMSGPKPSIDYGRLAAEVPEVQAKLEYVDNAILEVVPMVAMTLVDLKPDSKNHSSHLLISQAEKEGLVSDLDRDFGKRMDQGNLDNDVGAAKVLKFFLVEKGFKGSDEPWD